VKRWQLARGDAVGAGQLDPGTPLAQQRQQVAEGPMPGTKLSRHMPHVVDHALHRQAGGEAGKVVEAADVDQELHVPAQRRDAIGHPAGGGDVDAATEDQVQDRKSTRLNSSHVKISYAVLCLKKKKKT